MAKITSNNPLKTPAQTMKPIQQQEEPVKTESIEVKTELQINEVVQTETAESPDIIEPKVEEIQQLAPVQSADQQPKQQNKTMTESKDIIIKLDKPAHIKFVMQTTGEESPRIIHDQKIALSRGTIYKLPITDETLDLQQAYVIRPTSKIAETIRILNVSNGFVTIEPIVHGGVLVNDEKIGSLI